jgi:alpha-tubulin suppressor-like RCC1 family protein
MNGKPKHVSFGDDDGFAIDTNGKLHSWSQTSSALLFKQLTGYSFKQVSCGKNGFVALLQTNGSVWIRFKKDEPFVLINKGDLKRKTVSKIAVGANHVAALTTDGKMYTLGSNERGQCGILELKDSPRDTPHLVEWKSNFTDISTGSHHTVAVTDDGKLVGFGYNKNLQLGKPQEWVHYSPPSLPFVPFGTYHEVRKSEQERFASKSWNDTTEYVTQYAHTNPAVIDFFQRNSIRVTRVECGDEFTFAFDESGNIYGFGDGGRGQLARNPPRSHVNPTVIHRAPFDDGGASNITTLSCGTSHCMAMTKSGELWSWGWNGQGECGRQSKVFTPMPVKVQLETKTPLVTVICSKNASVFIL